jgi:hypothetical protein
MYMDSNKAIFASKKCECIFCLPNSTERETITIMDMDYGQAESGRQAEAGSKGIITSFFYFSLSMLVIVYNFTV